MKLAAVLAGLALLLGCSASTHATRDAGLPDAGTVDAGTGPSGAIRFGAATARLSNPASPQDAPSAAQTLSFTVTVYDDTGSASAPSPTAPVTVNVYGPGVVTPSVTTLTANPLTLTYDGHYFGAPMLVTAQQGTRVGVLQLVGENRTCQLGAADVHLPLACAAPPCSGAPVIENGIFVEASVGGGSVSARYQLDTGSQGVVLPASELGPEAIGPGPAASVFYDSSGKAFSGHYWLARVTFADRDGNTHRTVPMMVLATTSASCHPGYPSCTAPANDIHLLGIGFDRKVESSDAAVNGPALNPFLQLEEVVTSNALSPGYVLTAGSTGVGQAVVLGVTPARKGAFHWFRLVPSDGSPGDWQPALGCFGFPALTAGPFCGTLLVDTGVPEMFLNLPDAQRPAALAQGFPDGTGVQLWAPDAGAPQLSYAFTFHSPAEPGPPTLTPVHLEWGGDDRTFVNTGRHLLAGYDYLYDAACGAVGFAGSDAL